MVCDVPIPPSVVEHWDSIKAVALLALQRTSYILLAKSPNRLQQELDSFLRRCCDYINQGRSFCESIVVNRASYTNCSLLYAYTRERLMARPERQQQKNLILDASVIPHDSSGADLVRWIYSEVMDKTSVDSSKARLLPRSAESARLKDLRKLLLAVEDTRLTLMLPSWTEDILFRPTFDANCTQKMEDALLYTLIDIVNERRIKNGGTGECPSDSSASWSLLIFLNNTERMLNIPPKVRSRLGVAMTPLDFALNLEEYQAYVDQMEKYALVAHSEILKLRKIRNTPVGKKFLQSIFSGLKSEFEMRSIKTLISYPEKLRTFSATEIVVSLNSVFSDILKYDAKSNRVYEPVGTSLVRARVAQPLSDKVATPERPHRPARGGGYESQSSPECSAIKQPAKRTSALSITKPPRQVRMLPAVEDEVVSPDEKLRLIFWQHLPLIDLCVLLAWLNLHENQKLNYITGAHIAQCCQPMDLSPTFGPQFKFHTESIYHSIHILISMRLLAVSHAQMITEAPEVKMLSQAKDFRPPAPDLVFLPFMSDPLIFPMWQCFGQFLNDMRQRRPTDYPSWLVPRTDRRIA